MAGNNELEAAKREAADREADRQSLERVFSDHGQVVTTRNGYNIELAQGGALEAALFRHARVKKVDGATQAEGPPGTYPHTFTAYDTKQVITTYTRMPTNSPVNPGLAKPISVWNDGDGVSIYISKTDLEKLASRDRQALLDDMVTGFVRNGDLYRDGKVTPELLQANAQAIKTALVASENRPNPAAEKTRALADNNGLLRLIQGNEAQLGMDTLAQLSPAQVKEVLGSQEDLVRTALGRTEPGLLRSFNKLADKARQASLDTPIPTQVAEAAAVAVGKHGNALSVVDVGHDSKVVNVQNAAGGRAIT